MNRCQPHDPLPQLSNIGSWMLNTSTSIFKLDAWICHIRPFKRTHFDWLIQLGAPGAPFPLGFLDRASHQSEESSGNSDLSWKSQSSNLSFTIAVIWIFPEKLGMTPKLLWVKDRKPVDQSWEYVEIIWKRSFKKSGNLCSWKERNNVLSFEATSPSNLYHKC